MVSVGLSMLVVGCAPEGPTSTSTISVDWMQYWPEAEYRINDWLGWHLGCRSGDSLGYILPVIDGVFESGVDTCTYSPGTRVIKYNPEFLDGCMAHELGHAALHQAGNSCWRDYEHDLGDR